ncbi:hypothetical protein HME9302_00008 [Alteripontixanthobacter maritimus]|uniref:Uncharacterized protein n=1 Tax=Alteripontixanthobacter maritimus TaxID=2161824 RepID=A0A369QTP4_9SPHN|nr:hypothetical protein [Alteripontixanthobacter maritimus]RDC66557.1 hypothetical protein HME9302_00008 [Alteripontixanthobacter maritimus]
MRQIGLTGLLRIELPEQTIRLCDGGFFQFEGEIYQSADDTFGTIGGVQSLSEGVGDSVPALNLSLLPSNDAPPGVLSKPGYQTSRVRFWLAEYDVQTGAITSADVQFDGRSTKPF